MKKRPASLEALIAEPENTGATIIPFTPPKPQVEKLTVYVPRAAAKRLRQMALDHERRVNDFLQEGVDLMLAKYGEKSLREFEPR
jgi:molybdopterin-guanine dinucleotide biosynthesis protein A